MGLSSQWNFGSSQAMQHHWLSNGQMGEHFALRPLMLKPRSVRVCSNPFCWPSWVVILCIWPRCSGVGLLFGITVSLWWRCLPPFPLFISNALSASGGSAACADDWSNIKRAWQPGWAASNVGIAKDLTCSMSWAQSQYGSAFELERWPCEHCGKCCHHG